jgi:hypothetical protein
MTIEITSTFQKRPAYRYVRKADHMPTFAELPDEENFKGIICKIKLFDPTGSGTWYLASVDQDEDGNFIAYGVADLGHGPEAGDIWLNELVDHRGLMGLPIERDLYWSPKPMAALLS